MPVNISVIFYSATGSVTQIAQEISESAEKSGATVRLHKVAELAPPEVIESIPEWKENVAATADIPLATAEDVLWADGVIFGTPTRFGNVASQLKQFLDTLGQPWRQGLLAGKVYSGFTSTATHHGGHESTLLALVNTFHHFGGIIVPPGYPFDEPAQMVNGNPYGTSHWDQGGAAPVDDVTRTAARVQAKRVVRYASAIKAGLEAA